MSEQEISPSTTAPTPKKRSFLKRFFSFVWRTITTSIKISLISTPFIAGGLYWGFQHYVVDNPGPQFTDPNYVTNLLTQDSRIYYRDGETIMDAISYKGAHRYYVEYEELPEHWKDAIVSMEDKNFWNHHGIEPVGIVKAIGRNLKGTRSGGSTLTQQTAKNLFDRDQYQKQTEEQIKKILKQEEKPRSKGVFYSAKLWAKVWEALNALRLEEHFEKKEILTFYANQFQVHGTGRGLGVAARYFFDKTPAELTLFECAYLAAIVKGPNNYNPFTKNTAETKEETIKKAIGRTQTVLNRMREEGYITQAERDAVYQDDIPFNRGRFRFENSTIYDLIQNELEHPSIKKSLQQAGIINISTAGLHIIATIDEEVQRKSEYALRHHLTELSGQLNDYSAKAPLRRPTGIMPRLSQPSRAFKFYEGVVTETGKDIVVDIGGENCIIHKQSIKDTRKRLARLYASTKQLKNKIKQYSRLLVSKREDGKCDIELDGMLQGGLIATQKGAIVSIVGGRQNRFFNRAWKESKVQLGSTWKPLIYAASLQLGWSIIDQLDNYHNAFYYQDGWYFPKGHADPAKKLSMMWTGVHSENRATVWLLYHMSHRLPFHRAKELAKHVGMTPRANENAEQYEQRMIDWGIRSSRDWQNSIAYYRAQREVLLTMEEGDEKLALMTLNYHTSRMEKTAFSQLPRGGRRHNKQILKYHYRAVQEKSQQCLETLQPVQENLFAEKDPLDISLFWDPEDIVPRPQIAQNIFWDPQTQRIVCESKEDLPRLTWDILDEYKDSGNDEFPPILLYDHISIETLEDIERKMKANNEALDILEIYHPDYLLFHSDFMRQMNLRFVDLLAQKLGFPIKEKGLAKNGYLESSIPLVLAMSLGSTEIPLYRMNDMYAGLTSGVQYRHKDIDHPYIIDRIIDDTGALIYQAEVEKKEVYPPVMGKQIAHILHNVIQSGTGRRAKGKIKREKVSIPTFGKTGTTDSVKRAAFFGAIPHATEDDSWSLEDAIFLGVSVAFDIEKPMAGSRGGIYGSKGGLPIWIPTAQAMANSSLLGEPKINIPWKPQENLVVFIDKYKETSEIENWFYSEDKSNLYRIMQLKKESILLSKTPPPALKINLDEIDFDLEEEEEEP